jgi:acetyl-CoA acyltransferase 1
MARTAMTRAKRGPQRDTGTEAMLKPVLEAVVKQANIDKALVEDVVIGNVLCGGAGSSNARMALYMAGYPDTTCVQGINRLCSSGLQAVATVANAIRAGQIQIGIGGGVESMSNYTMTDSIKPELLSEEVYSTEKASHCLMPMGITSENVAKEFGVSRQEQDELAESSHKKAAHAQKEGWSQAEITPYKTTMKMEDGSTKEVLVDKDDGVRAETT